MEERNNEELVLENDDDVMLPGFRFHPTDEELVGFYLKMKIQQRPLCIELIRQLDIYKYDPWDLPKLAASGEKEWYFYCQRDRKYRNSARPNRVTGAGFWKATGTDRPVYSSNCSSKSIIGLKKSLVFYKGRACKALKTDWMMHEFRDPSNVMDSWAICRIFKKTNVSRRGVSSTLKHEITYEPDVNRNGSVLCSKTVEDVVCNVSNDYLEGKLPQLSIPNEPIGGPSSFTAQPMGVADIDVSSLLLNMSASFVGDFGCRAPETSEPFSWFQSVGQPDGLAEQPMYGQDNALLFEDSKPWESAPPPSSIGHALSCIWDKLLN